MKAVVCTGYGPPEVLKVQEVSKPKPGDDEVLIRIHAASVHIGDTRIRRADPFFVRLIFGLTRPKKAPILGMELSGVVEELGRDVKRFNAGDKVFAFTGWGFGGYAEYICLPAKTDYGKIEKKGLVEFKPENISFGESATVPAGAMTVSRVFQKMDLREGHRILINGSSGSLGTYAIQFARNKGAEITGVCGSNNIDLVTSLGADHVIDHTREDIRKWKGGFDFIFDTVGNLPKSRCRHLLKNNGRSLNTSGLGKIEPGDLKKLKRMIEKGNLLPVIDRTYDIEDIVEAHRYVEKGHKRGNVIIRIMKGESKKAG